MCRHEGQPHGLATRRAARRKLPGIGHGYHRVVVSYRLESAPRLGGGRVVESSVLRSCRLLITGASGTGTTALGRAHASRWSVSRADVDDYFWVPTSPPYAKKRPVDERLSLMSALFLPRDSWVLSGSLMESGDPLIERFSAVVFLTLESWIRMDRLKERETARYGSAVNEAAQRGFFDWARGYDDASSRVVARPGRERWLALLPCPVLRLDSAEPVPRLLDAVTGWLNSTVNG